MTALIAIPTMNEPVAKIGVMLEIDGSGGPVGLRGTVLGDDVVICDVALVCLRSEILVKTTRFLREKKLKRRYMSQGVTSRNKKRNNDSHISRIVQHVINSTHGAQWRRSPMREKTRVQQSKKAEINHLFCGEQRMCGDQRRKTLS